MKIGIYGGSFNPVHQAHVEIARKFRDQLSLDKLLIIPAFISPFKRSESDLKQYATAKHRLEMLKIAFRDDQKIEIETFEIDRKAVSYTIDTIEYLEKKCPEAKFYLLIGGDNAKHFRKWKDWETILEKTTICIAKRPDSFTENELKGIIANLTVGQKKPIIINSELMDISASEIRDYFKSFDSNNTQKTPQKIKEYFPSEIHKYILENDLYK